MVATVIQIAIDGPSGAGKSSVAKILSEKLGILYLNTGAMYRAFAYNAVKHNVHGELTQDDIDSLFNDFDLTLENDKVFLNGEDISSAIRSLDIDRNVSIYASVPYVREKMVALQKKIAQNTSIVMEGRDICTVVLPDTPYKFYLDPSVDVRAKRRYDEDIKKGLNVSYEKIRDDIIKRDEADSVRDTDPLQIASDALVIDSSTMSIDEVADEIISIINKECRNV